jgi:Rrf2 family protein
MSTLLKVSDAASLAFHAAVLLAAQDGTPISTRSVATRLHASECHLSKVLQRLAKAGMVRSVRGPKGGFVLSTDPSTISLMEVYEAIEGPFVPNDCLMREKICHGEERILGGLLAELNAQVKERLSKTYLSSLTPIFD